jgi:hypothetical protein
MKVRAALGRLKLRPGDLPDQWKRRIAALAMVTVKWLTRAVNSGEIAPPDNRLY